MEKSNWNDDWFAALTKEVFQDFPVQAAVITLDGEIVAVNGEYSRFALANCGSKETAAGVGANYLKSIDLRKARDEDGAKEAYNGLLALVADEFDLFRLIYPCESPTEIRWFLMLAKKVGAQGQYILITHTDVTQQKKTEKLLDIEAKEFAKAAALHAAELEQFFTVSLDMHCIANEAGYFLRVNASFVHNLGWTEEELLSRPFVDFVHPEDRAATKVETSDILTATAPFDFENRYKTKSGRWRIFSWKSVPSGDGLIYATARDVTAQREAEALLRLARDEAERANLAKSDFLSRMSHELRTPLNAVLGFSQLLGMKYQEPDIKKSSEAILKAGRHLLQLINEILDLSRIEGRNLGVSLEVVQLREIVEQTLLLLRPAAEEAEVTIEVLTDFSDVYLESDRQRLLQVMLNVIGNAVKFNRRGGFVHLSGKAGIEGFYHIEISDTGRGIPPEAKPLMFQPFQRFGDPGVDGTGLGLALSQRFIGLMGGSIELKESSSSGSTFALNLKSADAPIYNSVPTHQKALGVDLAGTAGTVLYVEDNLSNIGLIEVILAEWGDIRLLTAVTGSLGLELAAQHRPDLILLDVHLPDVLGDEILRQLKASDVCKEMPVVMLSADATKRQISSCLELGAADYLMKPVDISRFFEVLSTFLGKRKLEKSGAN